MLYNIMIGLAQDNQVVLARSPCGESFLETWQHGQDAVAFVAKLLQRSPIKRYTAEEASHLMPDEKSLVSSGGFHGHGVTPIAGWFTREDPI